MPVKIPSALSFRQCQRSRLLDNGSVWHCLQTATWRVELMKGDEPYYCCNECVDVVAPFERGADWIEYAHNDERKKGTIYEHYKPTKRAT